MTIHNSLNCPELRNGRVSSFVPAQSPRLEISQLGDISFSQSISCLLDKFGHYEDPQDFNSGDITYDIENYTNIREIDPEWDDNEIEEIILMSPKGPSKRFVGALTAHAVSLTDFEIVNSPAHQKYVVCKKRGSSRLYALKSLYAHTRRTSSEEAVMDVINSLNAPFFSRIHWSINEDHALHVIMDYFPKGTLLDYITDYGPLSSFQVTFYASEIAAALYILHSTGIQHRDLNPEVIMLCNDGHIVLTEFGSARIVTGAHHMEGEHHFGITSDWEKHIYRAPELLLGWNHSFAVDCWSFGMLMHLMLYGSGPFNVTTNFTVTDFQSQVIYNPILLDFIRHIHPAARDLIVKCLERNPELRLDIEGVRRHPYFEQTKWTDVIEKRLEVPPHGTYGVKKTTPLKTPRLTPDNDFSQGQASHYMNGKFGTLDKIQELPEFCSSSVSDSISRLRDEMRPAPEQANRDSTTMNMNTIPGHTTKEQVEHFWDMIDRGDQASLESNPSLEFGESHGIPYTQACRLRKQRSFFYPPQGLFSFSTISFQHKLRRKPHSTSALKDAHMPIEGLPEGIKQIGDGIGFTYNLQSEVRSKGSLSAVPPKGYRGIFQGGLTSLGVGMGLGMIGKNKKTIEDKNDTPILSTTLYAQRDRENTTGFFHEMCNNRSWVGSPVDSSTVVGTPDRMIQLTLNSPPNLSSNNQQLTPTSLACEEMKATPATLVCEDLAALKVQDERLAKFLSCQDQEPTHGKANVLKQQDPPLQDADNLDPNMGVVGCDTMTLRLVSKSATALGLSF